MSHAPYQWKEELVVVAVAEELVCLTQISVSFYAFLAKRLVLVTMPSISSVETCLYHRHRPSLM